MKKQLYGSIIVILVLVFAVGFSGQTGVAQDAPDTQYGSIVGTVFDPDGVPIPGVGVTLSSESLVTERTTISNAQGMYRFVILPPGDYTVTYMLGGMNTLVRKGIVIQAGDRVQVDVGMSLKTQQETVVVCGKAPMVNRQLSSSSHSMDLNQLRRQASHNGATSLKKSKRVSKKHTVERSMNDYYNMTPGVTANTTNGSAEIGCSYNLDGVNLGDAVTGPRGVMFGVDIMDEMSKNNGCLAKYGHQTKPRSKREIMRQKKCKDQQGPRHDSWHNTEEYSVLVENGFKDALQNPLSTFSIDVDTASYANCRRYINGGSLPPHGAVRVEEFVNYFNYDYPQPDGDVPFAVIHETSVCPWNTKHDLVHIGLQGKRLVNKEKPVNNLVFLIDVSGSMSSSNKLDLLKQAYTLMVKQLSSEDRVAIVVYAGAAGVVLPSTPGSDKHTIMEAIRSLSAGGSTAGGQGIRLAYKIAEENFMKEANNRVILATDGDFNVGVSSTSELVKLIETKREKNIFLTVLGFGMGNYKDGRMEQLADKGNGNYFYIDNLLEAKKVLVDELTGTLVTIAKDVKIQVEFNPAKVKAYKLVGYENRMLAKEDFNDDTKDAGELGAGHTVTALYEIVPADSTEKTPDVDELKYQKIKLNQSAAAGKELLTVKLRYKEPKAKKSKLIVSSVPAQRKQLALTTDNFRFSSAVAEFALLLRDSKSMGNASFAAVLKRARLAEGEDKHGYRAEFRRLVEKAQLIKETVASR